MFLLSHKLHSALVKPQSREMSCLCQSGRSHMQSVKVVVRVSIQVGMPTSAQFVSNCLDLPGAEELQTVGVPAPNAATGCLVILMPSVFHGDDGCGLPFT